MSTPQYTILAYSTMHIQEIRQRMRTMTLHKYCLFTGSEFFNKFAIYCFTINFNTHTSKRYTNGDPDPTAVAAANAGPTPKSNEFKLSCSKYTDV